LQLAQEIKSKLGDYTSIKTDIPSAPQEPDEGGASGTLSKELEEAAKIFNLSGVDITVEAGEVIYKGEWIITGLTEFGASLTELTLPDELMGLPVTTIADGCFKDSNVSKLIFGCNISSVNKAAFDGCANLRGIYITSLDPNTFHPSSDILDGLVDCVFYVPEEVYTDYILDYFWGYLDGNKILTY